MKWTRYLPKHFEGVSFQSLVLVTPRTVSVSCNKICGLCPAILLNKVLAGVFIALVYGRQESDGGK